MTSRARRWLGVGRCTGRGVVSSLVMNMRPTASPSNGEWKVGNSCQALSAVEASISVAYVTELRFITIAGRTVEIVGVVTHGVVAPRLASPPVGAAVHAIGFAVALCLLLGRDRQRVRRS